MKTERSNGDKKKNGKALLGRISRIVAANRASEAMVSERKEEQGDTKFTISSTISIIKDWIHST